MSPQLLITLEDILGYGNILQIMPPQTGWEAVYTNIRQKGKFYTIPINCWALVEYRPYDNQPFTTLVVGMVVSITDSPSLTFIDTIEGFIGYNYPGCNVDWHIEAEKYRKKHQI